MVLFVYNQEYSLILLLICYCLGCGCPNFCKNGTARGVYYQKLGVLRGVPFMDCSPWTWIILVANAGCLLFILNLILQSTILRPLGIRVFSLWIQTNSLLPTMKDLKFSPIEFGSTCNYLNVHVERKHFPTQFILNFKNYCRNIIPFVGFYKKQIASYNCTVHELLTRKSPWA